MSDYIMYHMRKKKPKKILHQMSTLCKTSLLNFLTSKRSCNINDASYITGQPSMHKVKYHKVHLPWFPTDVNIVYIFQCGHKIALFCLPLTWVASASNEHDFARAE